VQLDAQLKFQVILSTDSSRGASTSWHHSIRGELVYLVTIIDVLPLTNGTLTFQVKVSVIYILNCLFAYKNRPKIMRIIQYIPSRIKVKLDKAQNYYCSMACTPSTLLCATPMCWDLRCLIVWMSQDPEMVSAHLQGLGRTM